MKIKNYYEVLGIPETSSLSDIKKVYRTLAKKYHPDKNSNSKQAEEKFKEISEAYKILSDKKSKLEYDELLKSRSYEDLGFTSSSQFGNFFYDYFEGVFEKEILKGDDVNVFCRLTLEELKLGCKKVIALSTGKISINIPPDSLPDSRLKVAGKGLDTEPPTNNPGDLIIRLVNKPHNLYEVVSDKGDIRLDYLIPYQDLILGKTIRIKTLTSKIQLTIPPNTDLYKSFRLKGQGLRQGDLIVRFKLYIPKTITQKEKEALKKLNSYKNLKIK